MSRAGRLAKAAGRLLPAALLLGAPMLGSITRAQQSDGNIPATSRSRAGARPAFGPLAVGDTTVSRQVAVRVDTVAATFTPVEAMARLLAVRSDTVGAVVGLEAHSRSVAVHVDTIAPFTYREILSRPVAARVDTVGPFAYVEVLSRPVAARVDTVGPFAYRETHGRRVAVLVDTVGVPVIVGISPNRGGIGGSVSVVIVGRRFQSGATTTLTRFGEPDIVGTQVVVAADSQSLAATFDLTGAALGPCDVVVTNPDLKSARLASGFTIDLPAPHQLRVDVIGPTQIRPNRRRPFDIVLQNLGNTDLPAVPLWITGIPDSAAVELDFAVSAPPQAGGEPDWSQAPLTFSGPGGRYLPLVIPRVPPGVTVRRLYLTVANPVTAFQLDAALAPPWADGAVFRACLSGAAVIQAPGCMGAQITAIEAYLAATPGVAALSGIGLWAKVAWQCEGATSLAAALAKAEQVLDLMLQPVEGAGVPSGCELVLVPQWQDRLAVQVVTSVDPNDKLGVGLGMNQAIGRQLLTYSIRFENLESASAHATCVVVTDALDGNALDLGTVSLGAIRFGKQRVEAGQVVPWTVVPLPGVNDYIEVVPWRPDDRLFVKVEVHLDRLTGALSWSLVLVDSAGAPLCDQDSLGFLPPNVMPPEGEGSLLFTAMPRSDLAGGAVIRNQATIFFDNNLPIQTPEWTNTLDATAPESRVLPLAASQDSSGFTVRWETEGAHPDVRDYSVYVAEDQGPFRAWRTFTTATADTFVGRSGHHYAFYSLARDSSGNLEGVPAVPDAKTYALVGVEDAGRWTLTLEGAHPNPATGPVRVWFTLPSAEGGVLEVMDVAGRRLVRREVGQLGPGRHSVDLSAALRRSGLYFARLAQGGRVLLTRIVVIR